MSIKVFLYRKQRRRIEQRLHKSTNRIEALRSRVMLLLHEGCCAAVVVERVGRVRATVYPTVCRFEALGEAVRTLQRWEREGWVDRRKGTRAMLANRLRVEERAPVPAVLNEPAHGDKSPNQLVPMRANRVNISLRNQRCTGY